MGRPPAIPAEQKARIVMSVIAGELSVAEAARREKVSEQSIGRWKADFLEAGKTALAAGRSGPSTREQQLEAEVARHKGRVRMAKINVDENQMIAGQLRVQSIPTVYAFFQGQPVDAFQGAIPQSQIKQFVEKLVAMGGDDGGLAEALAKELAEAKDRTLRTLALLLGYPPFFFHVGPAHQLAA